MSRPPDTPRRPALSSMTEEIPVHDAHAGNGNRTPAEKAEDRRRAAHADSKTSTLEVIEAAVLETQEQMGLIVGDQFLIRQRLDRIDANADLIRGQSQRQGDDIEKLRDDVNGIAKLLNVGRTISGSMAAVVPPGVRPPAPSFSSIEEDIGEKVITRNGTERMTVSQEQAIALARAEYLRMEQEAQDARDRAPVIFVKGISKKIIINGLVTVGVAGVIAALLGVGHYILEHFHP